MSSFFTPATSYNTLTDPTPDGPTQDELRDYSTHLSYDSLLQSIDTRLALIDRCIAISHRILETLSTPTTNTQSSDLKQSLHDSIHNAKQAVSETGVMVGTIDKVARLEDVDNKSIQLATNKYKQQLKQYNDTIKQLDKSAKKYDSAAASKSTVISINDLQNNRQSTPTQQQQQQQQSQQPDSNIGSQFAVVNELSQQEQLDIDAEVRAKQQFILEIERDVLIVQQMFIDLNEMVYAQQASVDSIEQSIIETANKTYAGMKELYQAEQYQRSKRRKMCCMVLMMALIILTVIMVVSIILHG